MPTESLILRRVFPVPVTFADLRRAHDILNYAVCDEHGVIARTDEEGCCWCGADAMEHLRARWHAAIKEATGALDEVYAVIDGHEVRVAIIEGMGGNRRGVGPAVRSRDILDLLIKADEQSYWERPREVFHALEEHPISRRTVNLACGVSVDKAGA